MNMDGHNEEGSLRRRALQSSLLLAFQAGGSQIIRLGGNLILTRILVPEAFGLVALVYVLMTGIVMLTDLGVRDSVMRASREDPDFLNTAWTIRVVQSFFVWLALALMAVPYADFYDQPLLAKLVPIGALQLVIMSLESTKDIELNRKLMIKKLVPIEIASQLTGLLGTVGLALWMRSVWALVWGMHIGALVRCILTHTVLPGTPNRFRFEAAARKEIIAYGRWVMVSSSLTFGANSLDRLVLGKLVPIDMLGIFGIAKTLASAPQQLTDMIGYRVVFPLYRSIIGRGEDLAAALERARWPLMIAAGWLLAGVSACAQPVVDILYDERYAAAGGMLRLLPIGIWFQTVGATNTAAIRALGKPRVLAMASAAQVATLAIGLAPAAIKWGITGGISVLLVATLMNCITSTVWLVRHRICTWHGALPTTGLVLVSALAGCLVEAYVDWHPLLRIAAAGSVTTVFWLSLLFRLYGEIRKRRQTHTPVPA